MRLLIYFNQRFRFKLSSEIQSLTFSLHSELSRGLVLDQACREVFQKNNYPILNTEIQNFLKQHISDINEKLAEFYFSLSEKFKIKYLALAAQILSLEMKFSTNNSTAFEAAYNYFAHCDKNQNTLKSSLGIVFITMDAMVFIYLAIIFFILPGINLADNSWWESSSRPSEMFFSSALFWLAYLTAIFLIKNREESLR